MKPSFRIVIYADQWRDIVRNGVKTGVEQVLLHTGGATRPRREAMRIMNFLRKRGHTFAFIQRV
jgi:hypothetical protein